MIDSVVGLTPGLHAGARHDLLYNGHAMEKRVREVRGRRLVLRKVFTPFWPPLLHTKALYGGGVPAGLRLLRGLLSVKC